MKASRESIGFALGALRKSAGFTLRDLEDKTGISRTLLSRTETALRDMSFADVVSILAATNSKMETFISLIHQAEVDGVTEKMQALQKLEAEAKNIRSELNKKGK